MAIGKSSGKIDVKKLTILIGPYKIFSSGSLYEKYDEKKVSDYMKNDTIIITVEIGLGNNINSLIKGKLNSENDRFVSGISLHIPSGKIIKRFDICFQTHNKISGIFLVRFHYLKKML